MLVLNPSVVAGSGSVVCRGLRAAAEERPDDWSALADFLSRALPSQTNRSVTYCAEDMRVDDRRLRYQRRKYDCENNNKKDIRTNHIFKSFNVL